MSSDKLRKYLAYYQKTLRDDPENIEARLRLAALFREMGQLAHAIDEYVTASKLLAAQGLPLEAIAACKAVLELDPSHTEVQFFLARLFAQAPDAAGRNARVARPIHAAQPPRVPELPEARPDIRLEVLDTDELDAFSRSGERAITLHQAKSVDSDDEVGEVSEVEDHDDNDLPTSVLAAVSVELDVSSLDEPSLADDSPTEQREPRSFDVREETSPARRVGAISSVESSDATVVAELRTHDALRSDSERQSLQVSPDLIEELRSTQAIDPEELAVLEQMSAAPGAEALLQRERRDTLHLGHASGAPRSTGAWHPYDRSLREQIPVDVLRTEEMDAFSREDGVEDTINEESFEVGVFNLESVDLDEQTDAILDTLDAERDFEFSTMTPAEALEGQSRTKVTIRREELPVIPLFSGLNQFGFVELLREAKLRDVPAGETILSPGHGQRSLFILVGGEAEAFKLQRGEQMHLSFFGEGDFFGEFGLLTGRDGAASVRARTDLRVLEVTEPMVAKIAELDPEIWDTLWDYYHIRMLNNLMVSDEIFRHLEPDVRDEVIDWFVLEEYEVGAAVLTPEEPCGHVYLVLFGELEIAPVDALLPKKVLREGEFFGFVASLSDEVCKAHVTALKECVLLCLPSREFRMLTRQNRAVASEIRSLLRERIRRNDLFLTGITRYADTGVD